MKIVNEDTKHPEMKKSKSNKGHPLLVLSAIWLVYVSHIGFCFEQHRKLTDKEFFTIVFNELLKTGDMKIQDYDNTAETYLAHHPNCCQVYGNNLFGFVMGFDINVYINYEMSDQRVKEINTTGKYKTLTYYESITYMTACGRPYHSTGMASTTPGNKKTSIN
ncbi:hypothetical protein [Methylobacter tundripaludum]|uniref:Uncharacterized protein n=1 Tax=Methylobacter tundripaludum (strain ATCC BAA-1195 / DSM 17260 / SV96) TaxID=697282 RepID=G3IQJ2_METTV|nr:hypothetical protein [Methylobacter tundripaludum]EGW22078.1 hypothetical protein Mettu_0876 [Methylobacter tundripaludum SV96]